MLAIESFFLWFATGVMRLRNLGEEIYLRGIRRRERNVNPRFQVVEGGWRGLRGLEGPTPAPSNLEGAGGAELME